MLFNSLQYVLFVAFIVTLFWASRRQPTLRAALLLAASWLFYMSWNPAYIVLIIGSTVLDYSAGLGIGRARSQRGRRAWLLASVAGNLGLLGLFKYFNFFMQATGDTLRWAHAILLDATGHDYAWMLHVPEHLPVLRVLLPVGISFYTFQTMSYTIDIYRGRLEPTRNFIHFAAYVAFFPQLVAGPIVRARDFLPQMLRHPRLDPDKVGRGLFLIMLGLIKKVAVADWLAVNFVDRVFDNPHMFSSAETLAALYGYTVQLYCDFSGYTDVAIGTALLMGFVLPENFDRPYQATNPAEFWRRWHMTLSSWLRDYLYFPLGGSRRGPVRTYFNLFITLFLIGLWHGAAWTFVLYGLLHGTAMVLHRFVYKRRGRTRDAVDPMPVRIGKIAAMFHFTVLSRILFRATSVDNALAVWRQLWEGTTSLAQLSPPVALLIAGTLVVHWTPRRWVDTLRDRFALLPAPAQGLAMALTGVLLFEMATGDVVPYVYFQF